MRWGSSPSLERVPHTNAEGGDMEFQHETAVANIKESVRFDGMHPHVSLDAFIQARDAAVATGATSAEEINHLPEVRAAVKRWLLTHFQSVSHTADVQGFLKERAVWVAAGVFTNEEVMAFPEVRVAAERDIRGSAHVHPAKLQEEIDKWLPLGVVTRDEMDAWIQDSQDRRRRQELS